jgi:hypothetical protein
MFKDDKMTSAESCKYLRMIQKRCQKPRKEPSKMLDEM